MKTFGTVIGFLGIGLVAYDAGWLTAVGLFLTLWGDNVTKLLP